MDNIKMEFNSGLIDTAVAYDLVGLLGVLLYVGSYSALQLGRMDGNSLRYCVLNGCAATLVLISLFYNFNLASAVIQVVWITVSLLGVYRYFTSKKPMMISRQPQSTAWHKNTIR